MGPAFQFLGPLAQDPDVEIFRRSEWRVALLAPLDPIGNDALCFPGVVAITLVFLFGLEIAIANDGEGFVVHRRSPRGFARRQAVSG